MNGIKRVLIIGGGVGGLTAAIAFAQRGVEAVLIERRPCFDVPGVGLGQPANALRVYDACGLLDQVLDTGFIYDHMTIFDANRQLIAEHKFLLGDDRIPPVCALPRADLHRILLDCATRAGVEVRLGVTADIFREDDPAHVTVGFSDGRSEEFDLVAGFDGIRSTTRAHMFGTMFVPTHSGFGAWRVQVPRPDCVTGMEFFQGIRGKAGAMPINKETMYLFNIRPEPAGAFFPPEEFVPLLRERLSQFGSYVAEVSATLKDGDDIVYSPLEPLLLPWPWHQRRIVLGGDAAHVVPPHLTQGAAMAAEDGLILAHELTRPEGSVEDKLMRYSRTRYARCAFVYTFSRQWLEQEQSVQNQAQMEETRRELSLNASRRIAVSDRILNTRII